MREKLRFVIAILITAIILPSGRVQTQPNVPLIAVDTLVNLGKNEIAQAGGAMFLPDGNIIAIWKGVPLIIDSKSGETIRYLDALPSGFASSPALTPDGSKLVTRVTGAQMAVWDVLSGKIIKQFKYVIGQLCISQDGTKMYVTEPNNGDKEGIISIYDMVSLERIERFCEHGFASGGRIAISPDGQTLAVSVYKKPNDEYDTKTNQVILIDLKDKTKYTVLETFEPQVYSMEFSPDGKQIAFPYSDGNNNIYIYIYNLESKQKKYVKLEELSNLFGIKLMGIGKQHFINSMLIMFAIGNTENNYVLNWNIFEKCVKNIIKFNSIQTMDIKDSTILLCNKSGVLAYLNKNVVPVKEISIPKGNYIIYNNNQLEYFSDISYIGQCMIFDTTGKLIFNLGSQPFTAGKNIIRINQPIPRGIYILTIKDNTSQTSYKFLVE